MSKPKANRQRVIRRANLPMRMPLWHTLVLYLFLDRLHAPGFVWGAVGLYLALGWGVWIYAQFTESPVDVLSNSDFDRSTSASDQAYERKHNL